MKGSVGAGTWVLVIVLSGLVVAAVVFALSRLAARSRAEHDTFTLSDELHPVADVPIAGVPSHPQKLLGRAFVLEAEPVPYEQQAHPRIDYVPCSMRVVIFCDGRSPIQAQGMREILFEQRITFSPGHSYLAVWVDPESPDEFVLDFTQPPPEVRLGVPNPGPDSINELLAAGTDGTARVEAKVQVRGVLSSKGDGLYNVRMTITSVQPPYETTVTQTAPDELAARMQPGVVLPVKIGSTPDRVVFAY
jgi:hypothetical protein